MNNHKDERSILERQGEVTPWAGEVQLQHGNGTVLFEHHPALDSPYQHFIESIENEGYAEYSELEGREEHYLTESEGEGWINDEEIFENETWADRAAKKNLQLSQELGWDRYLKEISALVSEVRSSDAGIAVIGTVLRKGYNLLDPFKADDPELARRVSDWQAKNKSASGRLTVLSVDGIIGLDTWTVMQEALGLLGFNPLELKNMLKSKLAHAKKKNRRFFKDISIFKALVVEGIIRDALPLNEEYFSYAVAQFQRKHKVSINGYLNEESLKKIGYSQSHFVESFRKEIEAYDANKLAECFIEYVNKIKGRISEKRISLQSKIKDINIKDESYSNWKLGLDILVATFTTMVAIAAAPGTGGTSIIAAKSAAMWSLTATLLNILGKENLDQKEINQKDQASAKKYMFNKLIEAASTNEGYSPPFTRTGYQAQKYFESLGDDELKIIRDVIAKMYWLLQNPKRIDKIFLLNVFSYFKPFPRLIIAYNNNKPVENWNRLDVENVKNKHAKLRIEFFEKNPINVAFDKIGDLQYRDKNIPLLLKNVWEFWLQQGFSIRDFTLRDANNEFLEYVGVLEGRDKPTTNNLYVFFKANYSVPDSPSYLVDPHETLVKILPQGNEWSMVSSETLHRFKVIGKPSNFTPDLANKIILFNNKGHIRVNRIDEKNTNGLRYSEIILDVVNHVMDINYNITGEIIFWEGETNQNIETKQKGKEWYPYYDPATSPADFAEFDDNEIPLGLNSDFLRVPDNLNKTTTNRSQVGRSGIAASDILQAVGGVVDVSTLRRQMERYNLQNPNDVYQINASNMTTIDAVFTEAIHQFQTANYFDPTEYDGVLNASTLDSLGFKEHKLRPKLNSEGWYGQDNLIGLNRKVSNSTKNEFTSGNWFRHIVRPAFLGYKIKHGVHLILWRKLQEAQTWLLVQPQYKGMTPVQLGRALGLDQSDVEYRGSRLSAENQAMHSFGLAIDIDPVGNPWIGAGWVKNDKEKLKERHRMLEALRKASGERLPGSNVFEYLHSIVQSTGSDTRAAYGILKKRHDDFIGYLQSNPTELRYWKNSATFGGRDPLKGFLNLHPDLVYALREVAGLAWGAIDFGPRACGDIMHFDLRTQGVGKVIATHIKSYIPVYGHPILPKSELEFDLEYDDYAEKYPEEFEAHEAIGEAEWEDNYLEPDEEHGWQGDSSDPETE